MNRAIFLALILLIAACSRQDDRICQTPPAEPRRAEQCVHRHAYLMADADGSITEVAKAAAQKCDSYVLEDSMRMTSKSEGDADEHLEFYEKETLKDAIQRVTEARAGNCDKPES